MTVLGSPSLITLMVSVDVKQTAEELCETESRGGRPGLPVPNNPDGFRGRKATALELCESRGDRQGLPVPNTPNGFGCGRQAT